MPQSGRKVYHIYFFKLNNTLIDNTPTLYSYKLLHRDFKGKNHEEMYNSEYHYTKNDRDYEKLRVRERLWVKYCSKENSLCSIGFFDVRKRVQTAAYASLILTLLLILFLCIVVTSFSVPVSALIVLPLQRMVRFLGMLVKDPLGYERNPDFHKFVAEQERKSRTSELLDGKER